MEKVITRVAHTIGSGIKTVGEDWQVGIYWRRERREASGGQYRVKNVLHSQAGGFLGGITGSGGVLIRQAFNDISAGLSENPVSQSLNSATLLPQTNLHWSTVGTAGVVGIAIGLILDNGYSWWVGRRERRQYEDA